VSNNDKVWKYYGEHDPYFGVATVDAFLSGNIDDDARSGFFTSGRDYVDRVWEEIGKRFGEGFRPRRAVDFGCGVGRLVVPLAERCGEVVGVDISEGMLAEAARNCAAFGVGNAKFILSDDELTRLDGTFDLIHSFIVFQHIRPETGERIFRKMVGMLADGGIGVVQFSYRHRAGAGERLRFRLYRDFPFIYRIRKLLRPGGQETLIPMYEYDLGRLFTILRENGCDESFVRFSFHGFDGVVLFFRKAPAEAF
jgi:SAM-dependent methyltransferase